MRIPEELLDKFLAAPTASRARVLVVAVLLAGAAGCLGPGGAASLREQPAAEAPAQEQALLNSERIERAFGSYGIDVLASDAATRVSNLYSVEGAEKICRTFAVTLYPTAVDPRFAEEHAAIAAGGSIGATFAARGWTVLKANRYFGEIGAPARLAELMQISAGTPLAVHVYVLDVVKDGARFEYATIAEAHHPQYLTLPDLPAIYGAAAPLPARPDEPTRRLLERLRSGG